MYTQLKLFTDPMPDPNSETESEDELLLREMRNKRRSNDEGPKHEERDVLHSEMKAYTDLVFELPNKLSSRMGKRRSLKHKTRDIHQRRDNLLRPISWTQIAKRLSPERGS